jgi:hypothetical protein
MAPKEYPEPLKHPLGSAFVSDRTRLKSVFKQDLLGKIVRRRKTGFWQKLRFLMSMEPAVSFKHYSSGEIDIELFVFDNRIAVLEKCVEELLRKTTSRISQHT